MYSRRAIRLGAVSLVALATVFACDDGVAPHGPPTSIVVVDGDAQQGTVGSALSEPVVVRVADAAGRPVPDALVTFHVVAGGGAVALGTAETDEDGEAREFWTLGTSTAQS